MHRLARVRSQPLAPAPWWAFVVAGFIYGLCTALAMPPVNVWPLALVAVAPLVWAGCRATGRFKRAALLVAVGTLPFWGFEQLFLWDIAAPGYPALCVYLSLYAGAFVWIIAHARRADWPIPMAAIVPVVWTALEVLRGEFVLDGYSFFLLGHPLINASFFAAPGAVFGAYGVSFLCAALAGAVADAAGWSGVPRSWGGMGASTLAIFWFLLGLPAQFEPLPDANTKTIRVAAVQTNLPQDNKMGWSIETRRTDHAHFLDLTRQAAAARPTPDVICWPETMFPGMALNPEAIEKLRTGGVHYKSGLPVTQFGDDLASAQAELGVPMLVGCAAVDGDILSDLGVSGRPTHSSIYNSIVLVDKGRPTATRYDKIVLMTFGEVIPYLWRWPELQNKVVQFGAAGMMFELSPGSRATGIDVPIARSDFGARSVRLATPICIEGAYAGHCRDLVRGDGTPQGRAAAMINFSNDGWFGWWDAGRRQHMLCARWRCLELGVPMVRCVNTGVSCVIDAKGRVVSDQLSDKPGVNERTEGVLLASIPIQPDRSPTIFERVGLVPAYGVMGLAVVGTLVLWRRSRRIASGAL